jgi:hypothetical protein
MPFSNLGNQGGQVLPGFTYSSLFHSSIVLHVALLRNYRTSADRNERRSHDYRLRLHWALDSSSHSARRCLHRRFIT